MSISGIVFQLSASVSDRRRDKKIPLPGGVTECRNIRYGPYGKWSLLDVYYPDEAEGPLPTIVSIHGGGYVYGTKEIYRRYGMDMAARGFAFVNFNYRLAPKWKFPTPLHDTNAVLQWIVMNADRYHLDPGRLFLVGDSAGGQLASQYAAMLTNPEYMALFHLRRPDPGIQLRAVGLNCGLYDMADVASTKRQGLELDYLGRKIANDDPRLQVMSAITPDYPPAHITTACHDFLRGAAQPMYDHLRSLGVPARMVCYGSEEDASIGHVFHVNILKPEAIRCNDEQCDFFRQYL